MTKIVYVCKCCGEAKPMEAYKTWMFGPVFSESKNIGRAAFCLECQAKRKKGKDEKMESN